MAILEKLKYIAGFPARVIREYKKRNEYIDYVCEASGWTRKETIAAMNKAKKEGISYRYYAKKRLWSRTEAQMQQVQKNAVVNEARKQAEAEHAVEEVMKATGWSRLAAEEKMKEARQSCGSSYKDYYRFRLYEKTPEEQKEFFTLGVFETLSFKYNPDPAAIRTLLQKGRFAKKFSKQFNRVWFINRDITFEEFSTLVKDLDQLICKPLSSTQGKGIIRIRFSEYENLQAVYREHDTPVPARLSPEHGKGAFEGKPIAHAIVDDCDHESTPFVEGISFANRGSMATAWRKLRATDLKVPSMMWCEFSPAS